MSGLENGNRAKKGIAFDSAGWIVECSQIFTSSGASVDGWLQRFIEKLASSDRDAKKIRMWLSAIPPRTVAMMFNESTEDRLKLFCVLTASRRKETDPSWTSSLNVTARREYLAELADAATKFADLVKRPSAPPLPPLWRFLSDDHAACLLELIGRDSDGADWLMPTLSDASVGRIQFELEGQSPQWLKPALVGDHEPPAMVRRYLENIKARRNHRPGSETEQCNTAKDERHYRLASGLYPGWDHPLTGHFNVQAESLRFLRSDTVKIMEAFAAHVRTLSVGDEKTEVGADDHNARVRMAAKSIYRMLVENFSPNEAPYAITASCLRLLYPATETKKVHWPKPKDVNRWVGGSNK